jgi:phage terminase large subunit-like protein
VTSAAAEEALDLLASLVLEDGRRWGEAAVSWQWEDGRAVLDPEGPPYHFLTRPRGGSKTTDLAGIALAAMLAQLPAGARLYGLAADRDQGRLLVDAIEGFAERTPELRGALRIDAYRVTATRSGSILEVLAADAPSAWGLRPSFVVVDEIAQWAQTDGPRRLWEAVSTAAAKLRGCRLVVLTTAGDPAHWARKVLDHAIGDPLWRVHEVAGPVPWLDRARLEEQRRRLPESSFQRLFLNRWVAVDEALASPDDLRACVTLDGPLAPDARRVYALGLDLGLKRDRTAAAVCHAEAIPGGDPRRPEVAGIRIVLDRLEVWQGSRDHPVELAQVEEFVAEAARAYRARVVLDPWQAVGLAQRLRRRGVRVVEFSFTPASAGRLASTLHVLLRSRALALPADEALLDELASVRLRETAPGIVRLDHGSSQHDDRAVALALAAHHLLQGRVPSLSLPVEEPELSEQERLRREHEERLRRRRDLGQNSPIWAEWARLEAEREAGGGFRYDMAF